MSVLPFKRWLTRHDAEDRSATALRVERNEQPHASPTVMGVDDATLGSMVDTIGSLVQLAGAYAHDTSARSAGDARRVAELWRRHLTLGLEHPSALEPRDADDAAGHAAPDASAVPRGCSVAQRDWPGASRFAVGDRRAEHAHVSSTLAELRDTIWTLVHGLHRVAQADGDAGRASVRAIERHARALREADPDVIREAALAALSDLSAQLSTREQRRVRQLATLGEQVMSLGSALDAARRDSATDALTGIGNRRAFDAAIADAVAVHELWSQPACLVVLDVDGLKTVNDTYGHAAGDDLLKHVARQLARTFLRRTDTLARVGGDEFAVIMRDTPVADAARITARLAANVAALTLDLGEVRAGISAGVAALRDQETSAEWAARADAALYAAKHGGKGRVELAI